ncbi:hypothetical protein A3BBH6_06020 [Alistipes onderdonkii subsp. vulgaris]|uniref:hypothetical protein n=1 Tax=Alistipes onderdonkii TaxID=328813 RepID=UPI001161F684|nr:hypothetical protein [Alistipes onderdonkii]BBL00366.1 hypothetical protein A3BBH6_06020 [Alistipes onderdonkii subsp. vulgaris]
MAKVDYPIYKIRTDPHSKKVQGLKAGDVVRREYCDAPRTVYSLMVVLDTGTETVGETEVPYFTGALVEGDEPRADELLDFARITNLFDTERSGALYLTAADAEAPYMDVIDGLARDFALLWPETGGGYPESPDGSRYARQGAEYLDESYADSEEGVSRIYRLTRTAYEGTDAFGLKITLEQTVESSHRLLLSFKVRASAPLQDIPVTFGYTGGTQLDYADTVSAGTEWTYFLAVFTADYPSIYRRALSIDLTASLSEGQWFEIAELNLVRLEDIASFGRATKGRVGRIRGVVDPVFGRLDGYGAYFRNLYASGDVHIAGTLTAADERGFASTFYVGRIHRNCVLNSLQPQFIPKATWIASGAPTGIGGYCRVSSGTAILEIQSEEWSKAHDGQWYCFSFWARTGSPHKLTVGHGRRPSVSVALTAQWQRFYYTFRVQRIQGSKMAITFTKGVIFDLAAPQLEPGTRPTPYQPTDGVLRETDEYGAWFARGGIGGTIQHPLLRLDDDGAIRAGDDSFVINPDGTGHFAAGRFRWTTDTIALQDFMIRWEDLSEEARENLKGEKGEPGKDGAAILPDWVADWDSGKTVIDGSSVITPKIFAGVKNSDGTVTGVALGRYELLSRNEAGEFQSEMIDGLYGFHGGQKTFAIDTTGSVIIGRGEESIRYDAGTGKISFGKAVSMQWAGATYIDANGVFTGTLSADTVRAVTIDAAQITAGVIAAEHLDVDTLKARLLTAENIEALTLDVERGTIGGWTIDSEAIFRGTKCNAVGGYTAGPGAVTLSSNGIRGYQWRLEASGAGAVAGGRIAWDAAGKVTFAEEVSLNWSAPVGAITTALGGESYPRLTYISSTGIYTGTLTASQVNAVSIDAGSIKTGTLSADRIAAGSITAGKLDASSIRADIINTSYIEGLALNFQKGRIGGWTIGASTLASSHILLDSGNRRVAVYGAGGSSTAGHRVQIYYNSDNDFGLWASDASGVRVAALGSMNEIAGWHIEASRIWKNNVSLGADGSIAGATKWKLGNDGSGRLASGNIAWDTYGNVTFGASVSLQWTSAANAALASAKTYADTKKNEAVSAAAADATSKAEAAKELARAMAFGKMLYRVPEFFLKGSVHYNGTSNYLGNTTRTIEQVTGCPNSTGYALKYTATGWNNSTDKRAGGFLFGTPSRANAVFIVRLIAQIPIGRALQNYHNAYGTGGTTRWLTSNVGTGKWEEYVCKIVCGTAEPFRTLNHFALTGGAEPTAAAPLVWYTAYATVFDVTASEGYTTTLDANGIYTGTLTAAQVNAVSIDAGSIKTGTLSADRIAAGSIKADKLDAASIKTNIVNASYINGLELTFSRGKIGGWTIGADNITAGSVGTYGATPIQIRSASVGSGYWYEGSYKPLGISMLWRQIGNAGHFVFGQVAATPTTVKTGFIGLQMMGWEGLEYFCLSTSYARSGSKEVYNRIAGWAFDHTRIWKNNVSLGADGSIVNGSKWKLNNDGSGSIASGNISWNAAGAVTFGASVSLQWKNDIQAAKSANYGYRYYKRIVVNGDSATYYPVVFKGGDQTVQRDIMIRRSFNEQAPSDWNNGSTTHMGGLNLLIKTNFGGWGGTGYSWDIYDLQEAYSRMFAGAAHCGNWCMFAVFLRGGGTTGAVYHLYSDQPIESSAMSPSPIPAAPQIAYNSDRIFLSGSTTADAPAPRTLTATVEEEIRRHRFIVLAQGNDTTLKGHPLTYISSTGIYTGTIRANQIQVDSALVVGGSAYAGSISVRDAGNSVKVTLDRTGITAVGGKIGGWTIDSSSVSTIVTSSGHRVCLSALGALYHDDPSTGKDYWNLKSDGSATFGGGAISFNHDGSGHLAARNITWDTAGSVTMTGTITASAGSIAGFTIKGNRLVNTAADSSIEFSSMIGYASLYINSGSSLISMRADSSRTGINIETYASGARGIRIIANAGSVYAIESYGPMQLGQRGGERWNVPGVLYIGSKYTTGYNSTFRKIWGEGVEVSSFSHIGSGKYKVMHNLYHTNYTVMAMQLGDSGYRGFYRLLEKGTNYFVLQNVGVEGKPDAAAFEFIIFGRNTW